MCGIAGYLNFGASSTNSASLEGMIECIRHRGPDDAGIYCTPDMLVGLGSRRLAIIDLTSDGHMPMSNETNDVWVTFNGEIYNHSTLRHKLINRGHRFKSKTDTEVLIHLYEEEGVSFLESVNGMFAIALWDEKSQQLIIARDRVGKKPLYYAVANNLFIFASEIKSLISSYQLERTINLSALSQYLTYGFVMPPATLFKGVYKLSAGEVFTISKPGHTSRHHYWSPFKNEKRCLDVQKMDIEQHVTNIRTMLEESVAQRMVADVPVGAFLSGGLDSSTIVAIMSKVMDRPVDTVTVCYPQNPENDETSFARILAKKVGASYNQIAVTEEDVIRVLPECAYHLDEPISDPACINTYCASEYFRKNGVIVSLVGEGADELFLGYSTYSKYNTFFRYWNIYRKLPKCLTRIQSAGIAMLLNTCKRDNYADLVERSQNGNASFLSTWTIFGDRSKSSVLSREVGERLRKFPAYLAAEDAQNEFPSFLKTNPLSLMSLTDFKMQLCEKFLMRVDKMSMAHSIEVRAPFLDHRIAEYALSIPGDLRGYHTPKYLLRRAVADIIPEEIMNRPKMGFSTPIAHWFQGKLGRYLDGRIHESNVFADGILDSRYCKGLLEGHRSGHALHHHKLWNILTLAEWYDYFNVDGLSDEPSEFPF
jgi:asparagine synthase (glutamine-hydrolysing)